MSIDGALDRLDWFAADLDDLTGALRALAADPEGAARRAARSADRTAGVRGASAGRRTRTARVGDALQAAAARTEPMRVAVLDARAGQWFDAPACSTIRAST